MVRELIAEHRLTTLIGPGGSGKTRLAAETARTLLGDLPDGAWLVELASIGADGDVAQSALAALGLRDALLGGAPNAEPIDRLIAAIREREALLVLDNCERVIESAAAFAHRPGLGRNIMLGNPYRPTVGLHQRGQHVHRRLTRPILTKQGKDRAAGTSRSTPSSTVLSPYALRSPETAIAEFLRRPSSAPPLTRLCHDH